MKIHFLHEHVKRERQTHTMCTHACNYALMCAYVYEFVFSENVYEIISNLYNYTHTHTKCGLGVAV